MYRNFKFSKNIPNALCHSEINTLYSNEILKRFAGHSKWSNIKHIKMLKDKSKGAVFQRISKKIMRAVQEGGDNVVFNSKLKAALEEAKKNSVPNATIQNAIKNAQLSNIVKPYWLVYSDSVQIQVAFETVAPNSKGAISKINQYAKRIDLKVEKRGSDFFSEKGLIIAKPQNCENGYEKAVNDAIEAGIEEVFEYEDQTLIFECLPTYVDIASKKLNDLGYDILSATTEVKFHKYVKLNENYTNLVTSTLEKIQDNFSEIIRIEHNIEK